MAQTPSELRQEGESIDYTPVAAVTAGDVVVIGTYLVTIATQDIAAATLGAVRTGGVFNVPKDSSSFVPGTPVYWDDNGTPVVGTALSGAFTSNSALGPFAGFSLETAAGGVGDADILLRSVDSTSVPGSIASMPAATVVATGAAQGNANAVGSGFSKVTGADGVKGVILPTATSGAVVVIKNAGNAPLLVYPFAADAINAIAANSAYNMATNQSAAMFIALDSTTWFTLPLVAS